MILPRPSNALERKVSGVSSCARNSQTNPGQRRRRRAWVTEGVAAIKTSHQNVEQEGMRTCGFAEIHCSTALSTTESFGSQLCARCIPLYHHLSSHNTVWHTGCDKFAKTCNCSLPALFIMNADRSPTSPRPSIAIPHRQSRRCIEESRKNNRIMMHDTNRVMRRLPTDTVYVFQQSTLCVFQG